MTSHAAVPLAQVDLPFLDIRSAAYLDDPFATIAGLRAADPRGGRLLASVNGVEIVDYDLGREILADKRLMPPRAEHFRQMGAGPLLMTFLTEGKLTALEGERHMLRRRLLSEFLTPRAVAVDRDGYRALANGLVDRFAGRGECELIAEFAHSYPVEVLCLGLGIPQTDVPLFRGVTPEISLINAVPLAPAVPRIEAALQSLSAYTDQLLADENRSLPGSFVRRLAGLVGEGRMTRAEVVWSLVTLLQAAHYTTRNQLACIVRALIENDCWDVVARDPALIPAAVEEGMRYYPILLAVTRVVMTDDFVLDGIAMPRDTVLRLNAIGSGRDPHRFEDADRFDLHRQAAQRIPFGYGIHKCIGHTMARVDMEVALEVLTARLHGARLTGPFAPEVSGALWGPAQLNLSFTPAGQLAKAG